MSSLQFQFNVIENTHHLKFSGSIDEDSDFSDIKIPESCDELVIDLNLITMLNSTGLRSWVLWTKIIPTNVILRFKNCRKQVVQQMNILDGFLPPSSIVESFFVPYHCEACGNEQDILANRGEDFKEGTVDEKEGILLKEVLPCTNCKEEMEIDIIKDKYFRFLQYRR